MVFPVHHIIGGIHMVFVHQVASTRRSNIMRRIHIEAAISPDMSRRVRRIDIGNKRVLCAAQERDGRNECCDNGYHSLDDSSIHKKQLLTISQAKPPGRCPTDHISYSCRSAGRRSLHNKSSRAAGYERLSDTSSSRWHCSSCC